jgi:hypothetical protein
MYEHRRFMGRGVLFFCALVAASASCDGLGGNGGAGGGAGQGGQGGQGTPGAYCTNTPSGDNAPADSIEVQPQYFSDVTLAAGCIHKFPSGFGILGGANVTVEPGAVIEIGGGKGGNRIYLEEGALIANGTEAKPIEIRPTPGATFGGVAVFGTATFSLRHTHIHDATENSSTGELAPCLGIYGSGTEVSKGIVIEDSTFERCTEAGISFGSDTAPEVPAANIATMYSSFTRNKIIDSEWGFFVVTESLIAGIKEMPVMTGVKANVTDHLFLRELDLTLLDAGVPWWGSSITLDKPQAKLRLAPGVVYEVHDIFFGNPQFGISGVGEVFFEGTAEKPIVVSVDPSLHGSPGLAAAVRGTFRHVRFKGLAKMELGSGSIAENVTHENCADKGIEAAAFQIYGDDVVFANNTMRNCQTGIQAAQHWVHNVGDGNVYENVEQNRVESSSKFVGTSSWKGQSVPWVHDDIRIEGTLTLEPGVHIRGLYPTSGSGVILFAGAKLIAAGTAEKPVRFDAVQNSPTAWDGIELNGTASVDFNHVDLSEASVGIRTNSGPITIANSTFHDNTTDVFEACAKATVTSSTVTVKKAQNCP